MDTYYVRHTGGMDVPDEAHRRLAEMRHIGIHYPHGKDGQLPESDNASLNAEDYSGTAAGAIRRLGELAESGGYVCAEYVFLEGCVIGFVPPGTPIELWRAEWGDGSGLAGREAVLKTLPLAKPRHFSALESAVILIGRPKQGTIMRWRKVGDRIAHLVEGRKPQPDLSSLLPYQQEVMCCEFLRTPAAASHGLPRLLHQVALVGKTMKDIDICGLAPDYRPLLAQVTFSRLDEAGWKVDRLAHYGMTGNPHLVLFCNIESVTTVKGVTAFPLQTVFDEMVATEGGRKLMSPMPFGR